MTRLNEADLLEQFTEALAADPNVAPPAGLDPDLVEFVRALTRAEAPDEQPAGLKGRVWRRALQNARTLSHSYKQETSPMYSVVPQDTTRFASRSVNFLTILAAIVVLIILSGAIVNTFNRSQNPNYSGAAAQSSTPTPAAQEPTGTPPANVIPGLGPSEPLPLGQTITAQLTENKLRANYSFVAPVSGAVVLFASSPDFQLILGTYVIDPTGNGGGGGGGGGGSGPVSSIGSVSEIELFVEKGDTVGISVTSPSGAEIGSFSLTAFTAEAKPITYDTPVEGDLTASQQIQYFTFKGTPGDTLTFSATGDGKIDLALGVQEMPPPGSGSLVAAFSAGCSFDSLLMCNDDDSGLGYDPELVDVVLRAADTYGIILRPARLGLVGHFKLLVSRQPTATLTAQPQTVTLSAKSPAAGLVFQGKAASTVLLQGKLSAGISVSLRVTVLQGDQKLAVVNLPFNTDLSRKVTIPADGPVTVLIEYPQPAVGEMFTAVELSVTTP